jgi:tRNA1(Val) A37 N6-methylase TrmN6
VARALIARHAPVGGQVLDFAAGFGGRLLGALTLPVRYTGIDPAEPQILGLRELVSFLKSHAPGRAELVQGCAEKVMQELPSKSFDLIFSSPPYFNLEKYARDSSQSNLRYPFYDLWLTSFLFEVLSQSYRLLKSRGLLAINVANLRRYRLADDARKLGSSIFGDPKQIYSMRMSTNPADKARRGRLFRCEPILLFQKV